MALRNAPVTIPLLFVLLGLASQALAAGPAGEAGEPAPADEAATVILLSWDGVRHDYLDLAELPALERLASEGLQAARLTPVFPSNTFPGHVSLATGTYPDRHGIVDNQFFDRQRGWYRMSGEADWLEAEPLWISATRQGIITATYFWVGSESDWRGQRPRYRMAPFDSARSEAEKVDQIIAWLELPAAERPRLIMAYWRGADAAGHRHGAGSEAVVAALEAQDRELGRLLARLDDLERWDSTTLMVVSDHGMTRKGVYLDIAGALAGAAIEAEVVGSTVANIFLADAADSDRVGEVLARFEPVTAYRHDDIPERWRLRHPQRSGDWVAVVSPPYTLSRRSGFEYRVKSWLARWGWDFGGHGYDPALPDMGALLLAAGRGVPPASLLPEAHLTDVAPTVSALLGIDPPQQSEGRVLLPAPVRTVAAP